MTANRLPTILTAALLVASLFVGVAAPAVAAADANNPQSNTSVSGADDDATTADLAIRQPDYVNNDVREQTENGTRIYLAQGSELLVTPTNVDGENVTDYRVETDGGELTYDDTLGVYVFRPSGEGTYDLSWTTWSDESVASENGNDTTTETRTVEREYTANLRVDGGVNVEHITASESAERDHYLELGREVNATNQDLRESALPFARTSGDDYEMYQALVDRYVNTGNPIGLLTGNFGSIVTMLVMTMGGWLLIIAVFGGFGNAIRKLKKKLHIHESVEHEEGDIADRMAEVETAQRDRAFQNVDWNDLFEDDAVAGWLRDTGENPHDGFQRLTSGELCPENWMRDRLQAMGAVGYQATVSRAETADDTDGEDADDSEGEIIDATLATPDDGDDLEPIADLDVAQLVDAVDWGDPVLWDDFHLPDADIDFDDLERTPLTMDLDATMHEANLQVEKFPNKRVAGQCLRELVESVEQHEYSDVSGRPQTAREGMNNLLKGLQQASDRHQMPVQAIAEALEQALINHDPNEEARQAAKEVRAGAD